MSIHERLAREGIGTDKNGILVYRKAVASAKRLSFNFIAQAHRDSYRRLEAIRENGRLIGLDSKSECFTYEGVQYQSYVFGYTYDEDEWYFHLPCSSEEEAAERLANIKAYGQCDGLLGYSIGAEDKHQEDSLLEQARLFIGKFD